MGAVLTLGLSAHASTVPITFMGAPTGVNDGVDYVLPYQLKINGVLTDEQISILTQKYNELPHGMQFLGKNLLDIGLFAGAGKLVTHNVMGSIPCMACFFSFFKLYFLRFLFILINREKNLK